MDMRPIPDRLSRTFREYWSPEVVAQLAAKLLGDGEHCEAFVAALADAAAQRLAEALLGHLEGADQQARFWPVEEAP
jgi:hypothetical protein